MVKILVTAILLLCSLGVLRANCSQELGHPSIVTRGIVEAMGDMEPHKGTGVAVLPTRQSFPEGYGKQLHEALSKIDDNTRGSLNFHDPEMSDFKTLLSKDVDINLIVRHIRSVSEIIQNHMPEPETGKYHLSSVSLIWIRGNKNKPDEHAHIDGLDNIRVITTLLGRGTLYQSGAFDPRKGYDDQSFDKARPILETPLGDSLVISCLDRLAYYKFLGLLQDYFPGLHPTVHAGPAKLLNSPRIAVLLGFQHGEGIPHWTTFNIPYTELINVPLSEFLNLTAEMNSRAFSR